MFRNPGGGEGIVYRERGNDPSSLLDCGLYSEREVCGGGIVNFELNYIFRVCISAMNINHRSIGWPYLLYSSLYEELILDQLS